MEDAPLLTRDGDGERRRRASSARASTSVFRPTFALGVTLACACALASKHGVGRTIARVGTFGDGARGRASASERAKVSAFGSAAAAATAGDGTTPFAVVSDPFVPGGDDDEGASEEYSLVRKSETSSSGDVEVNHRDDVELTTRAAATMVHLTLLTAVRGTRVVDVRAGGVGGRRRRSGDDKVDVERLFILPSARNDANEVWNV